MKKKLAVILSVFLAVVFCIGITGCGEGGVEGTLKIRMFEGGYGKEFMEKICEGYLASNPEAKIDFEATALIREEGSTALETNETDVDIFMIDGFSANKFVETSHSLTDITELYSSTPKVGDREENITIGEKLKSEVLLELKYGGDLEEYAGNYYAFATASEPCSIILNIKALNFVLGEGNWKEPKTTDELLSLCAAIKAENKESPEYASKIYPMIFSGDAFEYLRYMYYPWIAQYDGYENWYNFCCVKKSNGKYAKSAYQTEGKKKAYSVVADILKYETGYYNKGCQGYLFTEAQQYFMQGLACIYVTGGWLESEMRNTDLNPELKMIRTPIISDLGTKLSITDDKLSRAVEEVDQGREVSTVVTDAQFEAIKEARRITYQGIPSAVGYVPAKSVNQALAIDFLRYYYSDEAASIIMKYTGMYMPFKDTSKITPEEDISSFRRSVIDISSKDNIMLYPTSSDPIRYRAGLDWYVTQEPFELTISKKNAVTTDRYLSDERAALESKWDDIKVLIG